jgi:hemerythrin-like metal-binding protein
MPIMTWDQSLDIDVSAMNDEHKQILDAMNRIHDATEAGRTGEEINRLVARLGAICVAHFKDEEAYMASIGYPGLTNHKFVHVRLLERYADHAAQIKAAGGCADHSFFHFLRHWLTSHIKGIDIKYGEHAANATRAA